MSRRPTVLVPSWSDGPTVLDGGEGQRAFVGLKTCGLGRWLDGISDTYCIDARGEALAIADQGGSLHGSQTRGSSWSRWAEGLPAPSGVLIC